MFEEFLKLSKEPLKSKIKDLYFSKFNYVGTKNDFCITQNLGLLGEVNLLWAEAKQGKSELKKSFVQLVLTIGKYKFYTEQTPNLLCAFDAEKIAFLPFSSLQEIFYQSGIDFSVTPIDDELAKIEFSSQANELLKAGKELFKYYHTHSEDKNYLANASLYDIKEFFQGRDEKGRMNNPSKVKDEHYKALLSDLNEALNVLAKKLEPKIYEYGFLKE